MDENANPVPPTASGETPFALLLPDDAHDSLRPQLRLHHFFALTAVAAVLLAINGRMPDYWTNSQFTPPKAILAALTAINVLSVLIISVAVTGLAYGMVWQRRGLVFFNEPGHWLMVEIGLVGLFSLVPGIVYRWLFADLEIGGPDFPMAAILFVSLYSLATLVVFPLAFNIYLGVKKCRETRWSLVFYLKAVANILAGIGHIVVMILVILAATRDRKESVPRDAAHWCGVWRQLVQCGLYILSAGIGIANMFFMFSQM